MSYKFVDLKVENGVGIMYFLNPPENRFNGPFLEEILDMLDEIEKDKKIKVLIVTSENEKFFCNGLDLPWMMGNLHNGDMIEKFTDNTNKMLRRFCIYPKPVIGAINGHAMGEGSIMATHFDYRVMREDKGWYGFPEVKINIPFLPGQIEIFKMSFPMKSLREICNFGRKYTAVQAKELDLIDDVASLDNLIPEAMKIADEFKRVNAQAFAEIKRRVRMPVVEVIDKVDPASIKGMVDAMRAQIPKPK